MTLMPGVPPRSSSWSMPGLWMNMAIGTVSQFIPALAESVPRETAVQGRRGIKGRPQSKWSSWPTPALRPTNGHPAQGVPTRPARMLDVGHLGWFFLCATVTTPHVVSSRYPAEESESKTVRGSQHYTKQLGVIACIGPLAVHTEDAIRNLIRHYRVIDNGYRQMFRSPSC